MKQKFGDLEYEAEVNLPTDVPSRYRWQDFRRKMKVSDFIDLMVTTLPTSPCYLHQQEIRRFPGLEQDISFRQFVGDGAADSSTFVWIGSSGTKVSLHFDYHENVLAQIFGKKRVFLVRPTDARYLYQFRGTIQKSRVDVENIQMGEFPKCKNITIFETVLDAGESLYIPRLWWHSIRSLAPSISVNYFFGPRCGVKELTPMVIASGPLSWLTMVKDAIWHGLCRVPYKERLYSEEPFGVWYYREVVGYFRRRLSRLV